MPFVRLKILPTVCLGALVDLPFLGAHEEEVLAVPIEVETAAPRQPRERRLLRVILHHHRHPDVREVIDGR